MFAALDAASSTRRPPGCSTRRCRDFRRSGVDRDDETRARITEINEQLTTVGQEFRQEPPRRQARPSGWPPSGSAACPRTGSTPTPSTTTGSSPSPPTTPTRSRCGPSARTARCAAQMVDRVLEPGLRRPTSRCSSELFELREELARLVGYDTWADYDADVKMIGKGSAIPEFIDRIAEVAQESAERDREVLLARLRVDHPDATDDRRRRLPVLRGAGPQGAVRRRRAGRAHVLRLRPVRAGLLDVTAPALRPHLHPRRRRGRLAPRRDGVRRVARRRDPGPHLPRPPPAREQVLARGAVHDHRRHRRHRSTPRACWCATSPRD